MKKRVLSLILVVVFAVSACCIFSACGDNDKKTTEKETTAPTNAATEAAVTEAAKATEAVTEAAQADEDNADAAQATEAVTEAEDSDGEEQVGATSAEYDGETAITAERAVEIVFEQFSYGDEYTGTSGGTIKIPDGSVWHSVIVSDENGEIVASYYVSDTTGEIKTTTELEAYAYR